MERRIAVLSVLLAVTAPAIARSAPCADRDAAVEEETQTPAAAPESSAVRPASLHPSIAFELTAMGGAMTSKVDGRDGGAGGFEGAVLLQGKYLAAGFRLGLDAIRDDAGLGFGVLFGPTLRLGNHVSVGVIGEVGIDRFSRDSSDNGYDLDSTTGSTAYLAALGIRSGLTLEWGSGTSAPRYGITLGGFLRSVEQRSVTYQTQDFCILDCAPATTHTVVYGGTAYGAYVGFSMSREFRR